MLSYPRYKVIETDSHIFFLTGPFSNWHRTPFHGQLPPSWEVLAQPRIEPIRPTGPTILFDGGEQWLMASKAALFGDHKSLEKIMNTSKPFDQKMLGREVGGFTIEQWNEFAGPIWGKHAKNIMFCGNWYKQTDNKEYRQALIDSDHKIIVEGNKNDKVWAVGLSWDDPAILDPANWNGTNWLGISHMDVRTAAVESLASFSAWDVYNPWEVFGVV
jgi:ribA/ribD-fused uncharacterized protein